MKNESKTGEKEALRISHPFPPLYCESSRVLILGSFPSVKSREQNFFYGHPQNRFWKVLAAIFDEEIPSSIEEKSSLVLRNNLALWDSIQSCVITGSSDSSVREVVPNDIGRILAGSSVGKIFCNGALSHKMYTKFILPQTGIDAVKLPSTSPANAAFSLERLVREWSVVADCAKSRKSV